MAVKKAVAKRTKLDEALAKQGVALAGADGIVPGPGTEVIPPLEPWQVIDRDLRAAAAGVKTQFLTLTKLAYEAIEQKVYERAGFADAGDYFDDHVKLSFRTVLRYVAVYRATKKIADPAQADEALQALAAIGVHKAAVLAPLITEEPDGWREYIKESADLDEESLQKYVSEARGLPAREVKAPGEDTLRALLNRFPPDLKPRMEQIVRTFMRHYEAVNAIDALVAIFECAARDLADQGHPVD